MPFLGILSGNYSEDQREDTGHHLPVSSPHHSRKWQTSLFVWAKQQPRAILDESLCMFCLMKSFDNVWLIWGCHEGNLDVGKQALACYYLICSVSGSGWLIWVIESKYQYGEIMAADGPVTGRLPVHSPDRRDCGCVWAACRCECV